MSVVRTIRCDECGETAGDYRWPTLAACRADMAAAGWSITSHRDLCDVCAVQAELKRLLR